MTLMHSYHSGTLTSSSPFLRFFFSPFILFLNWKEEAASHLSHAHTRTHRTMTWHMTRTGHMTHTHAWHTLDAHTRMTHTWRTHTHDTHLTHTWHINDTWHITHDAHMTRTWHMTLTHTSHIHPHTSHTLDTSLTHTRHTHPPNTPHVHVCVCVYACVRVCVCAWMCLVYMCRHRCEIVHVVCESVMSCALPTPRPLQLKKSKMKKLLCVNCPPPCPSPIFKKRNKSILTKQLPVMCWRRGGVGRGGERACPWV